MVICSGERYEARTSSWQEILSNIGVWEGPGDGWGLPSDDDVDVA
jgi:hypothetical protein